MSLNQTVVTFTDRAASKLREAAAREGNQASVLRIAVVQTHCMGGRGHTYQLALVEFPSGDDEGFEVNGVEVCIDPASSKYLKGAELDYLETLNEAGFKINNPNIVGKCPCGDHDIFE